MPLDDLDVQAIRRIIREELKPPIPMCGKSVLQDSQCKLPFTHTGLCKDGEGIWRCPWCRQDAFQGHLENCPAKDINE